MALLAGGIVLLGTAACLQLGPPQSVSRVGTTVDDVRDARTGNDANGFEAGRADGMDAGQPAGRLDTGLMDTTVVRDVPPDPKPDGQPEGQPDLQPDLPMVPKDLPLGSACQSGSSCGSGTCAEGVCCDSACGGLCESCITAGARGSCRPASAGTDPRNQCTDEGVATCGRDGSCDGARACRRYPADTVCAAGACSAGMITAASRCDSAGACKAGASSSCAPFGCTSAASPSCRSTCTSKADCSGTAECFNGACGGLRGEYFATRDLTGPAVTRIDRNVDFNFGVGVPAPTLPADMFSIRWTGKITPPAAGVYTFFATSDDGVVLWVNGQMIINQWRVQSVVTASGEISLTARTPVDIKLEYFDDGGTASVQLAWSSPAFGRQVVPVTALT
ncbi:MAG TPA: PA14 domain-containing protein, partial [Polyangia bacterium]